MNKEQESIEELLSYLYQIVLYFKQNPGFFTTFLYIFLNVTGLIISWSIFSQFGIEIFHYAETNDFLFGAFRDPGVLLNSLSVCFASVLYVGVLKATVFKLNKIKNKLLKIYVNSMLLVVGIGIYFFVFGYLMDSVTSRIVDQIRHSSTSEITLFIKPTKAEKESKIIAKSTALIGTTERLLFLLDKDTDKAIAIPRSSIDHIVFHKK